MESTILPVTGLTPGMQSAEEIALSDGSTLHIEQALTLKVIEQLKNMGVLNLRVYNYNIPNFKEIDPDEIIRSVRTDRDHKDAENSVILTELARERALAASQLISTLGVPIEEAVSSAKEVADIFFEAIQQSDDGCYFSIDQIKSKDSHTFAHSVDVAVLVGIIVKNCVAEHIFEWAESDIKDIMIAGLLHDLGKRSIPLSILNKPGKLTSEERMIIESHPIYSYQAIQGSDLSKAIKLGALQHHERYYGGGYPQGVSGERIHPYAQVIAVADVFDALTSDRPYRSALKANEAYEIMLEMSSHFNPAYMHMLFKKYILYPNKTMVSCSDNVLRMVIEQNPGYPTRPILKDINTENIVNLTHDAYLNVKIISTANVAT